MVTLSPDKTQSPAPSAIKVTRKGVDADGTYYDLQITDDKGKVSNARYHTSTTNSAGEGSEATNASGTGSNAGTQNTGNQGSVPVESLDPALATGEEEDRKLEIDPEALRAAIDKFETEQALGLLLGQDKEKDKKKNIGPVLVSVSEPEREVAPRDPIWDRIFSMDLSFFHGTGVSQGVETQDFARNRAEAERIAPPQPALALETSPSHPEIPAHVKSLALAAVGRVPAAASDFSRPSGEMPGLDFASSKMVIPPTRAQGQVRAFTPA